MTDVVRMTEREERLISTLVGELAPVRPLAGPVRRATLWIGAVAAIGCAMSGSADLASVWARLSGATDMWLSFVATCLTAVLAAIAAFQLSLPDRRVTWALLPLPAFVLWLAASGMGCLRSWVIPGVEIIPADHIKQCFFFIVGFSVPLSALMILMMRKGYSLHPNTSAALAGLAVAAAAAALLTLVHPFEATAVDLVVHFFSVGLVVIVNRFLGGALLQRAVVSHKG